MKRALVIGCPGAGKSVFSRELSRGTGLSLVHLDNLYWNADRTTVERCVFLSRLERAMKGEEWIIDGNYLSTMKMRIAESDTVFFFDLPSEVCLQGIFERKGKVRSDIPWIENEIDEEFLHFVENFNIDVRPRVLEILNSCHDKNIIIFKTREESMEYIDKIKK